MSQHQTGPGAGRESTPGFPWRTAAIAGGLAVALFAVLGYAVLNAGAAAPDRAAGGGDDAVEGVEVAAEPPGQAHEEGALKYDRSPAWGGAHNGAWMTCAGVIYDAEVPEENAVHSLEHGAVWITYRPDLPSQEVDVLADLVDGTDYRLLSPFPEQDSPVVASAWGRQLALDAADDPRLEAFVQQYTNGPQTPERGAPCSGGVQESGLSDPVPHDESSH